jgi:ATP-dependent RNA helicase DeaD
MNTESIGNFEQLGLADGMLAVIRKEKFTAPTLIQEKTIPLVMAGKDVIAGSATGSGKTLAFGAGIIEHVQRGKGMQALILAPTRELAEQIMEALKKFSAYKGLKVSVVYGGVSFNPQVAALARSEIIVGTPGRILDHTRQGTINYSNVKHMVLDEADRMLDMGFIDDVKTILSHCPKTKQTLLFSATIHPEITALANKFMHEPVKVSAEEHVDPKKLTQVYYEVSGPLKFSLLAHLIKEDKATGLIMVFCNSRQMVDTVEKNLKKQGIRAIAIHGGLTQNRRSNVLDLFHGEKAQVLVCTDVAARGLDIPQVSHIYNYDLPLDTKSYVHRIGRTARAGKDGKVINLLSQRDHPNFSRILYENDFEVKKMQKPFIEQIKTEMARRDDRPQHRGSRQFARTDDRARERGPRESFGRSKPAGNRGESPRRRYGQDAPRSEGDARPSTRPRSGGYGGNRSSSRGGSKFGAGAPRQGARSDTKPRPSSR